LQEEVQQHPSMLTAMCAIPVLLDRCYSDCSCQSSRLVQNLHARLSDQWRQEILMSSFLVFADESSPLTDLTLLSILLLVLPLSALVSPTRRSRPSKVLAKLA